MEVGEKVRNGYIGNVCVVVLVSINSNYVGELLSRKREQCTGHGENRKQHAGQLLSRKRAVHWTRRK